MARETIRHGAQPREPVPFVDPAVARLSEMLIAALSEITVMRERLDTVERLIEQHGLFKQDEIENYQAAGDAETARNTMRKRQIQKIMRPMLQDTERDLRESE